MARNNKSQRLAEAVNASRASVRRNFDLKACYRLFEEILDHLNRSTGQCNPGQQRLADALGLSPKSVRTQTAALEAAGEIVTVHRANNAIWYAFPSISASYFPAPERSFFDGLEAPSDRKLASDLDRKSTTHLTEGQTGSSGQLDRKLASEEPFIEPLGTETQGTGPAPEGRSPVPPSEHAPFSHAGPGSSPVIHPDDAGGQARSLFGDLPSEKAYEHPDERDACEEALDELGAFLANDDDGPSDLQTRRGPRRDRASGDTG